MKTITCPIEHFAGTVDLPEVITHPILRAWHTALRRASTMAVTEAGPIEGEGVVIAVILKIVQKWDLKNLPNPLTENNFPGVPRPAVADLVTWLVNEISVIVEGEENAITNPTSPA